MRVTLLGPDPLLLSGDTWLPGEVRHLQPDDALRLLLAHPGRFRIESDLAPLSLAALQMR